MYKLRGLRITNQEVSHQIDAFKKEHPWATKALTLIHIMKDRTTINRGLTINQLCRDMYPDDVDKDGFPTHNAKTKIRSIFHQIRKINPDCLFFSIKYKTHDGRLEWRYLNIANQEDVDDVIARLTKMAEGIERTEEQIMVVHQKGIKRRKKQINEWEEEVIIEQKKDSEQ